MVLGGSDGFKNPEIIQMRSFGLSHKQIDILLYQSEAEQFPGTFKLIIQTDFQKMAQQWPKQMPITFPMISQSFQTTSIVV